MGITLRNGLGRKLTADEMDENLTHLRNIANLVIIKQGDIVMEADDVTLYKIAHTGAISVSEIHLPNLVTVEKCIEVGPVIAETSHLENPFGIDSLHGAITPLDVLDAPLLEEVGWYINIGASNIETINLDSLTTTGVFYIARQYNLTELNLPSLTELVGYENPGYSGYPTAYDGKLTVMNLRLVEELDFSALTVVSFVDINSNPALELVDLSGLATFSEPVGMTFGGPLGQDVVSQINISDNEVLDTVYLCPGVNATTVVMSSNALSQACVDDVLAKLDASGLSDGQVNLSDGTNAAPSATGLDAAASLTDKGWVVTTN